MAPVAAEQLKYGKTLVSDPRYLGIIIVFGSYFFIYFDRIVCDLLVLMPFWLVCILHMEHSFLVCVVNEFCVSKHHHHHHPGGLSDSSIY
jgi:hypothetical protein